MNNPVLAQLRDIQTPDPIGFWPLAPGWYCLAILLFGALVSILIVHQRRNRRLRSRWFCLEQLKNLREQYQREGDAKAVAVQISLLLRRASMISFPRKAVAGLKGESWLHFLDKTGNTEAFSKGIGRVLLTAPYQNKAEFDVNELLNLVLSWVEKNSVQTQKQRK